MRSLAIIPARGGSKRVPGKNLASLGERLVLEHAIDSAAPCGDCVVSTDDVAIASVAMLCRTRVHNRKPEHATDDAQLEPVIDDVLSQYGSDIDAVVLLQPTSPLRTAEHVDADR